MGCAHPHAKLRRNCVAFDPPAIDLQNRAVNMPVRYAQGIQYVQRKPHVMDIGYIADPADAFNQ